MFSFDHFVQAQQPVYGRVCEELRRGRKASHWMWFVFPQMRGLGHSSMAQRFAIGSLNEAAAYAAHPVVGSRLRECCRLLLAAQSSDAHQIFGYPDDLKLKSSMTLFVRAVPEEHLFVQVLAKFFGREEDMATLKLLGQQQAP